VVMSGSSYQLLIQPAQFDRHSYLIYNHDN
jgi:hypothetical protein